MIKFKSSYSCDELINRWDDYTSFSRFAGCDDTMDLIFVSKRNGNKVRLIRKARISREPFSVVFHGKIIKTERGSAIEGFFSKSIADYVGVGAVDAILFYIRTCVIQRGEDLNTINSLVVIALIASLVMLTNFRPAKRKYAEFISRIVGNENTFFISKSEFKNKANDD